MGARDKQRAKPQGGVMAPAAGEPLGDVERTANSRPGVHTGRGEAEPASWCRYARAGRRANSPPGGML